MDKQDTMSMGKYGSHQRDMQATEVLHLLRKSVQEESQATDTYDFLFRALCRLRAVAINSAEEKEINEYISMVEEIRLDEIHHQGILYNLLNKFDILGSNKFQEGYEGKSD